MIKTRYDIIRERVMNDDESDTYQCTSKEEYADLFIDALASGLCVFLQDGENKKIPGFLGPFGVIKLLRPSAPQD